MNPPAQRLPWTVGIGLLLVLLTLALAFLFAGLRSRAVRSPSLPVYGQVADFALTNQAGARVSLADLRGHEWVADIIFTRCAGPCLKMSRQMSELQKALPPSSGVKLVSLTTDPDFDTPAILTTYARRFGAVPGRWIFLTGPKSEVGSLASGSLKLSAVENPAADRTSTGELFIHSTIFVVVDKQARLRGSYETGGEGVDWESEKQEILRALSQLERER